MAALHAAAHTYTAASGRARATRASGAAPRATPRAAATALAYRENEH